MSFRFGKERRYIFRTFYLITRFTPLKPCYKVSTVLGLSPLPWASSLVLAGHAMTSQEATNNFNRSEVESHDPPQQFLG